MDRIAQEIEALSPETKTLLRDLAFDRALLTRLAATLGQDVNARNRIAGGVEPPRPEDVTDVPEPGSLAHTQLEQLGIGCIRRGELAVVVLAGGMATRMGGLVKALVPVVRDHTFLDLRIAENHHWRQYADGPIPLWLMTSYATNQKLRAALGSHLDNDLVATFVQNVSLRLTPDGHLFTDAQGHPSLYASGHGDLPDALRRSGLLERFIARGGKYVSIVNVDNLGATIDPVILGWHASHGAPVSVEVVDKVGSDKGGSPVRWNDRVVIMEEFRMPRSFDPTTVRVFNTNTFLVDAQVLQNLSMEFTWLQVEKNVDGRKAVQFERLINEITMHLDTRCLRVPREGLRSRFLPVKDPDELEHRRPEIEAVAADRKMLG